MRLTLRFVLLVTALLLGVATSAASGWLALSRLDSALEGVVKGDMERLLAITHTRRLFRSMVVLERDYLLATTAGERQAMEKKLASTSRELLEQVDKYARLMPAEDARTVEDIRAARTRWLEVNVRVRAAVQRNDSTAVALAGLHAKDPISWETLIGGLVKTNERRLAAQVKGTHASYLAARTTLLTVSAAAALVAAGFGYVIFMGIRRNMREVVELNENLERLVKARTEALAARERSLRLVLDSTGDGIVGVRSDGTLAGDASAAAVRWFGEAVAGESSAAYFFPDDNAAQLGFQVALEQLLDDCLPREVLLDQMPSRAERDGRILELEYKHVASDTSDVRVLVLARDATARIHSEQSERAAREQQSLIAKLLSDKAGFADFVHDSERLIQALAAETDPATLRRDLHTLKGNVGMYGMASLARFCHEIEDRLEESATPSAGDLAQLATQFQNSLKGIEEFLTGVNRSVLEVEASEHATVIESLRQRKDYDEILKLIEVWSWSRTSEHLARLRAHAEYVAKRLDKPIRVVVEHNELRLPPDYLGSFWPTLSHVVRNAVDHGIEPAALRSERGKPAQGLIHLRTRQTDDSFCIDVADDGGGLDQEGVLRSARDSGMAVRDDADVRQLIFLDGLSTRLEASELSGRGVGLSATAAACTAEGGRIEVHSEPGRGTTFRFVFRRPVVKTGHLAAELKRRWSLLPTSDTHEIARPDAKRGLA